MGRKAREERDRMAKAEADRRAEEEADRKARADTKPKAETDRKAKELAEKTAKEEADRLAQDDSIPRLEDILGQLDIAEGTDELESHTDDASRPSQSADSTAEPNLDWDVELRAEMFVPILKMVIERAARRSDLAAAIPLREQGVSITEAQNIVCSLEGLLSCAALLTARIVRDSSMRELASQLARQCVSVEFRWHAA